MDPSCYRAPCTPIMPLTAGRKTTASSNILAPSLAPPVCWRPPWPASEGGRVPLHGGGEWPAAGGGVLQASVQRWAPLHLASLHPGVGSAAGCRGTVAPVDPMNPGGSKGNKFNTKVSRAWVPRPVRLNCWGAAGLCINCVSCFLFRAIIFFKGPRKCLKLSHFAKCYIIPNFCVM